MLSSIILFVFFIHGRVIGRIEASHSRSQIVPTSHFHHSCIYRFILVVYCAFLSEDNSIVHTLTILHILFIYF